MAMLEPGDILIDCTGSKSLLRDHLAAGSGHLAEGANTLNIRASASAPSRAAAAPAGDDSAPPSIALRSADVSSISRAIATLNRLWSVCRERGAHCFNAATANSPWRTSYPETSVVVSARGFNAATANSPWRTWC